MGNEELRDPRRRIFLKGAAVVGIAAPVVSQAGAPSALQTLNNALSTTGGNVSGTLAFLSEAATPNLKEYIFPKIAPHSVDAIKVDYFYTPTAKIFHGLVRDISRARSHIKHLEQLKQMDNFQIGGLLDEYEQTATLLGVNRDLDSLQTLVAKQNIGDFHGLLNTLIDGEQSTVARLLGTIQNMDEVSFRLSLQALSGEEGWNISQVTEFMPEEKIRAVAAERYAMGDMFKRLTEKESYRDEFFDMNGAHINENTKKKIHEGIAKCIHAGEPEEDIASRVKMLREHLRSKGPDTFDERYFGGKLKPLQQMHKRRMKPYYEIKARERAEQDAVNAADEVQYIEEEIKRNVRHAATKDYFVEAKPATNEEDIRHFTITPSKHAVYENFSNRMKWILQGDHILQEGEVLTMDKKIKTPNGSWKLEVTTNLPYTVAILDTHIQKQHTAAIEKQRDRAERRSSWDRDR